ncbi:MAG: SHOCT domain-containing protein [Ruminococcus sp.]|nr:SHOCT domain-containing protein [Ruminococcus sp.]
MENVICKANIWSKLNKVLVVVPLILSIIFAAAWFIPVREKKDDYSYFYVIDKYNIFGYQLKHEYYDLDDEFDESHINYGKGKYYLGAYPVAIVCIGLVWLLIVNNSAKKCSLQLDERGVKGQRKTVFSSAQLNLPIEKVDNIGVTDSLFNKLTGGKTVSVRSASGVVKFPWVHNADEFVEKTLAQIEEFKKHQKLDQPATVLQNDAGNQSIVGKIADLKNLLDQGVLTQEEFDKKKEELLNKM